MKRHVKKSSLALSCNLLYSIWHLVSLRCFVHILRCFKRNLDNNFSLTVLIILNWSFHGTTFLFTLIRRMYRNKIPMYLELESNTFK